jgi:hypothetical protein
MGMTLVNDSGMPAELFRMPLDEEKMLGIAVAKTTLVVGLDGSLAYDTEAPFPVFTKPEETELGTFPSDAAIRKQQVDLFVMGHARSAVPVPAMDVVLAVGQFQRAVRVFGDRVWVRAAGSLRPSPPVEFTEMPLTWAYAYGGVAKVRDDEPVPNMDNALGRGYVLEAGKADGVALPCIEDPDALIQAWGDQPRPICFAPLPLGSYLQAEGTYVDNGENLEAEPLPSIFNFAHPKHRIDALRPGDRVALVGCTPEPLRFVIPNLQIMAEVNLEDRSYSFDGIIDGLYLFPDTRRVLLVHRVSFTYGYVREEIRTTRLLFKR